MLSLFPSFLVFALFAPFLIRITIAIYFLCYTKTLFKNATRSKMSFLFLSLLSYVSSALVLIGAYTQGAALVLFLLSLFLFMRNTKDARFFFLAILSLSLLFLGAGFFAFDLPI